MCSNQTTRSFSGRCLCGAVSVSFDARPRVNACHCSMCRTWTGGPWLVIDSGNDVRFEGEAQVVRYESSDWASRGFCRTCGTHLFYLFKPVGSYAISYGILDDPSGLQFDEQIFIDEKPELYSFANETRTLTGAEVIAKYSGGD